MTDITEVRPPSYSNGHGEADLRESQEIQINELRSALANATGNVELLREQLAELELAIEDTGWTRISGYGDREFSAAGLRRLRRLARYSYLKNPIVKHPVQVQANYVWGQGCTMVADNDEDVNGVIQRFLDDPKNVKAFTGHLARWQLENELNVEGEHFFAMFTNRSNGRVIMRKIFTDEIEDIISNPDDYQEPWYYKRIWTKQNFDVDSGAVTDETQIEYHPDWRLTYLQEGGEGGFVRPTMIGGNPVNWDAPVYHLKPGGFSHQRFGVPEIYAALDWAKAVKSDLEDYATIRRALARFAWKATVKSGGKDAVAAIRNRLGTTLNQGGLGTLETNPPPVTGSIYTAAEGWDMTPMKTAGAVTSPEEGRRLWLMVAAGMGIPETMLSGDVSIGNLATAKTLDRPTELQMENRRQLWTDVYLDILNYVIDQAIKTPNGPLHDKGEEVIDEETYLYSYELDDPAARQIEIRFPSILRHELLPQIQAIVWAATLGGWSTAGTIDDKTLSSMLLSALGENAYDDTVAAMFPTDDLTFRAGMLPPPGATLSPIPAGIQSLADDNLPGAGGAPQILPSQAPIDMTSGYALMLAAREALEVGRGGRQDRKRQGGKGRSGLTIMSMAAVKRLMAAAAVKAKEGKEAGEEEGKEEREKR